ncbi:MULTISPECIES: hypothetical protein [unclassified Ruminococcus]|uniref:hypothetical protein n=1 Tax=unclassified Ruminococcus TaxID=2608920 RepID=UPI0011141AFD|nr:MULTISPECIES: hypothetical protein [unclassified Ruminococcus]
MFIILLTALLSGCANTAKEESAETETVSQTTTAAVITSETEITTTAESTTVPTVTTAETSSTSKTSATVSETKKTSTTTKKSTSVTTKKQTQKGDVQTYVVNVTQPATQQTKPEVTVAETKPSTATTTVQTTTPTTTTTQAPPTETPDDPGGIEWSDSMLVWRKLCEGYMLSDSEQDVIRSEILEYAMQNFNGKKDIHVKFGNDEYDISYEKPLNMTIRYDIKNMSYAHMDAYTDPNRKAMIDLASSESEIYDIVSQTREQCLHVIDYGLFNRWEIFSINNDLKYASDIEFNVGFDEDMAIWFLTED